MSETEHGTTRATGLPRRNSEAAFALISRQDGPEKRWLTQWNRAWGAYNFVGGHRLEGETFRQCCIREVADELGLTPEKDFAVAAERTAHLEYAGTSEGHNQAIPTDYTIELFEVKLLTAEARDVIAGNKDNQWFSLQETLAGTCAADGRGTSPTLRQLLPLVLGL
jgi:8-oxo-dGTP pyrophosphatase MutT (NUDIX family)